MFESYPLLVYVAYLLGGVAGVAGVDALLAKCSAPGWVKNVAFIAVGVVGLHLAQRFGWTRF